MGNFYFRKDWIHIQIKKYLYIDLQNPFYTMNRLKGVFIPLKRYFRCGKNWYPVLWCSKPSWIQIMFHDVMWKDKNDSPRFEVPPYIWIHLFGFNLVWYWTLENPTQHPDDYWEQALWYLFYYMTESCGRLQSPDIEKAKESWPWEDAYSGESSWNDKFLIK